VQEVQQRMMKRYVLSDIAKMLREKLEDYNIIARQDDHFLILLPEVNFEQSDELVISLRNIVFEHMGVDLQIGAASLFEDAITFESLVEKALSEMRGEAWDLDPAVEPEPWTTEHRAM
jgi:GGDEF domain-containing protein